MICTAAASHAMATVEFRTVAVAADLVHIGAAAVWVGGVVGIGFWQPGRRRSELADAIVGIHPYALTAVLALGLSGVVASVVHLATPIQLVTTVYGGAILLKATAFAALAGLGWFNRFRIVARLRAHEGVIEGFTRAVWGEVWLMVAV